MFLIFISFIMILISIFLLINTKHKVVAIFFIILSIIFIYVKINGLMPTYSVGVRVGYVTKVSEKGLFIKSYEGFMRSSNLGTTSSTNENGFLFSVSKEKEKLVGGMLKCKGKVQLTYSQYLIKPYRYNSDYLIYDFKCK